MSCCISHVCFGAEVSQLSILAKPHWQLYHAVFGCCS